MSAAPTQPVPSRPAPTGRWLFGPATDLLLGCGLLYTLAFLAHAAAGPTLRAATPGYLLPILILIFSSPHYGATLLRVYEKRSDRRAYVVFSVWATLVLAALFVLTLGDPWLGSVAFTLYLTWSPWHYSGQNYGLAVMFLGRRSVSLSRGTKRALHANFQLSFLLAALVMHLELGSAYSPVQYQGTTVTFLPLGITRGLGDVLLPIVALAYLATWILSAVQLRRVAPWRELGPTALLMSTQALWFVAPFSVQYWGWQTGIEPLDAQRELSNYTMMIFLGHGLQYLWVTTYYARAGTAWPGFGRYWLKAAAAGVAIWTLPSVLLGPTGLAGEWGFAGIALLIATFVNLHHFILDGAIWKLRSSRIAAVLIRNSEVNDDPSRDPTTGSPWLRRSIWATAGLGLAIGYLGVWLKTAYIPAQINRGELETASTALSTVGWLGADEEQLHEILADRFAKRGDLEQAIARARTRVALNPHGDAYTYLGLLQSRADHYEEAQRSFEAALASGDAREDHVHVALGGLAIRRGDEAAAADHLSRSIEIQPSADVSYTLAHLLATASDPDTRDPKRAVALAEDAVGQRSTAARLSTLSLAYAADQRLGDAIASAERAVELAERDGREDLVAKLSERLRSYRAR